MKINQKGVIDITTVAVSVLLVAVVIFSFWKVSQTDETKSDIVTDSSILPEETVLIDEQKDISETDTTLDENPIVKVDGKLFSEFVVGGHSVKIVEIEYFDQAGVGTTNLKGLANTGKLLFINLQVTNNTGGDAVYSVAGFDILGGTSIYKAYKTTSSPLPETKTNGGSTEFYIAFDIPVTDGQPVVRWSPPNTDKKLELTLPDVTSIPGYN